jgi:hypothetical protein
MTPEEMREKADHYIAAAGVVARRAASSPDDLSDVPLATAYAALAQALIARAQDVDALRPAMTIITSDDCEKMGWPKDWVGQQIELKFVEGVRR